MSWDRSNAVPYDGPFQSVPCRETFAAAECAQLRDGLLPESMEDKWAVFFDRPFLDIHRSWTGLLSYRVRLDVDGEGCRVAEVLVSNHVQMVHGPAYEAALASFLLRGMLLRQPVRSRSLPAELRAQRDSSNTRSAAPPCRRSRSPAPDVPVRGRGSHGPGRG